MSAAEARTVPVHPEPVEAHLDELRWVVPPGILPLGRVLVAPGALGALWDAGVLVDGLVERAAVWLRLGADHSWRTEGGAVRSALQEALLEPGSWEVSGPDDDGLRRVVDDVLGGTVGDYIRSHGGRIAVAEIAEGRVALDLAGTCEHCPAAGLTLQARVESAVRERWPEVVEVRDSTGRAEHEDPDDARTALAGWLRRGRG